MHVREKKIRSQGVFFFSDLGFFLTCDVLQRFLVSELRWGGCVKGIIISSLHNIKARKSPACLREKKSMPLYFALCTSPCSLIGASCTVNRSRNKLTCEKGSINERNYLEWYLHSHKKWGLPCNQIHLDQCLHHYKIQNWSRHEPSGQPHEEIELIDLDCKCNALMNGLQWQT